MQPYSVCCIGLGAMGWGIAKNLALRQSSEINIASVGVWNRTPCVAQEHAKAFGTRYVDTLTEAAAADVIVTCLPTSLEVADIASTMRPHLRTGSLWIDCTSGEPEMTGQISKLLSEAGVDMVDSPVSGGPEGSLAGNLTAMVGGASFARAQPFISMFANRKIVHCGGIGSGNAVKAANNCLNAAHLVLAGEALLALAKFGVQPEVALEAINTSSGRSLQTEVRIPTEVLSRRFDYGFKIELMLKDVNTAVRSLKMQDDRDSLIHAMRRVLEASTEEQGLGADYTCVVKTLENRAGVELHPGVAPAFQA